MPKTAVIIGVVATTFALGAGVAAADDVEGGGCEYGDASLNVMPSCDTGKQPGLTVHREPRWIRDIAAQLGGLGS